MKQFFCEDALPWLEKSQDIGSVVTSLPDAAEVKKTVSDWEPWFRATATKVMNVISPGGVAIFYQTDRKHKGQWISKAALLYSAAAIAGLHTIWHKIILRRAVNTTDLHRPGYTHLIAFTASASPGMATPDVIESGPRRYRNAMGENAVRVCVETVARCGTKLVDPFCGRGAVVNAADAAGIDAIGIDIDPAQIALCTATGGEI